MREWSPSGVLHRNAVTLTGGHAAGGSATAAADRGAPWLLLSHGFGTDQSMWDRMLPHLPHGLGVALMDHVGAGRSDLTAYEPHRYHSLEAYAADVVAVAEELVEVHGGPMHYVGHSAGGMIGALAAVARPELFGSLTLLGASPRYVDAPGYTGGFTRDAVEDLLAAMEANYVGFAHTLAPMAMANPERPELAEELAASFVRLRADIALDFARAVFLSDFREQAGDVTVPTLVVQSSADPMVPPEVGHFLHRSIRGSRLALLEATGHFPHMSGPAETARIVAAFLTGLAAEQPVA